MRLNWKTKNTEENLLFWKERRKVRLRESLLQYIKVYSARMHIHHWKKKPQIYCIL